VRRGRIMPMKNFGDTIGNRTRDLPAWSVVPQPDEMERQGRKGRDGARRFVINSLGFALSYF
jgi:hypothetical protein